VQKSTRSCNPGKLIWDAANSHSSFFFALTVARTRQFWFRHPWVPKRVGRIKPDQYSDTGQVRMRQAADYALRTFALRHRQDRSDRARNSYIRK